MLAVGAEKKFLVQSFFKCIERFQDQRLVGPEEYFCIVAYTFKESDITQLHKPAAFTIFNKHLVMFAQYAIVGIFGSRSGFFVLAVLKFENSICQALWFNWFEQVIQCIYFKCF